MRDCQKTSQKHTKPSHDASQKLKLSPCLPDIRPKDSPTTERCYITDTPTAVSPPTPRNDRKKNQQPQLAATSCTSKSNVWKYAAILDSENKQLCINSKMTETTMLKSEAADLYFGWGVHNMQSFTIVSPYLFQDQSLKLPWNLW